MPTIRTGVPVRRVRRTPLRWARSFFFLPAHHVFGARVSDFLARRLDRPFPEAETLLGGELEMTHGNPDVDALDVFHLQDSAGNSGAIPARPLEIEMPRGVFFHNAPGLLVGRRGGHADHVQWRAEGTRIRAQQRD